MSLLRILDELDQMQKLGPVLTTDSPDALRDAIQRAYVELLEKSSERTRGASPAAPAEPAELAADGHAYTPAARP